MPGHKWLLCSGPDRAASTSHRTKREALEVSVGTRTVRESDGVYRVVTPRKKHRPAWLRRRLPEYVVRRDVFKEWRAGRERST